MSTVYQVDDRAAGGPAFGAGLGVHFSGAPPGVDAAVVEPAAVGVDLGSAYTRIWASGRPLLHVPTISDRRTSPKPLVRRGRITDAVGLENLLARLLRRYRRPLPAGAVLVACRPVLATPDDELTIRRLLSAVFAPSRVLFIDTVQAAAIGAGAASGVLMVADVGAQLTEVAVLNGGGVAAARRAGLGMGDLIRPTALDPVVHTVAALVDQLRRAPDTRELAATAVRGGLLLVGGGATQPRLAPRIAGTLGTAVRSAARPRVAAVRGAGLAALSTLRRTAATSG